PATDLDEGPHSITFSAVDAAGNEGPQSTPFTFDLDTTPPAAAPTLGSAGDDVGPVTGALFSGGVTDDTRPTFAGTGGEPNATVNIYDNGVLIGTSTTDANGDWSFTPATELGEGAHSITFSAADA